MWLGGASGQSGRFDKHTGKFYNEIFDLGFRKRQGDSMLRDGINCVYKDKEGSNVDRALIQACINSLFNQQNNGQHAEVNTYTLFS